MEAVVWLRGHGHASVIRQVFKGRQWTQCGWLKAVHMCNNAVCKDYAMPFVHQTLHDKAIQVKKVWYFSK